MVHLVIQGLFQGQEGQDQVFLAQEDLLVLEGHHLVRGDHRGALPCMVRCMDLCMDQDHIQ